MDAITSITQPGGPLAKLAPLFQLGSGVLGTVGNIKANSARNQVLSSEMDQMKKLQALTSDPTKVAAGIKALQNPLSAGLTSGVGNLVQGQLAERGLSQAPGIFGTTLAQALAPFQMQEEQRATDAFFRSLGLPIQARPSPFGPFPESTNTSAIWQALFNQMQVPKGTPGITAGGGNSGIGQLPTNSQPGDWWDVLMNGGTSVPSTPGTFPGV